MMPFETSQVAYSQTDSSSSQYQLLSTPFIESNSSIEKPVNGRVANPNLVRRNNFRNSHKRDRRTFSLLYKPFKLLSTISHLAGG